jgi:predicted amidohydrolase YtcJ
MKMLNNLFAHTKKLTLAVSFIFCSVAGLPALAEPEQEAALPNAAGEKADLVLVGGHIYTMDASRTWAQAVAIREGKIIYVGSDLGAQKYVGSGTHVQELAGRMILPGFHDSHVHLMDGGMHLSECDLDDATTKDAALKMIADYAKAHQSDPAVIGSGWALPLFPDASPSKEDLDKVVPDRPALLLSQDYHSAWANSLALRAAGITKETADPPRGKIERDGNAEPSGTLRESAVQLVQHVMPQATDKDRVAGLARAVELANRFGITSVQDADADANVLNAYLELQRQGKLTLKVVAALHTDPALGVGQVDKMQRTRAKFTQGRLRATSAKIFADGVIEAHTASMCSPYSDRPDCRGIPNYTAADLSKLVAMLSLARFQVHIHAIGDQAVHDALDAFQAAGFADSSQLRHEIAHLELISPGDLERFRELGVVANCEMFWAFNDPYITTCTVPLIGPERSKQLYLFGSLYRSGATVAGGSDWPVTTLNPLDEIEVGVTRQSIDQNKLEPLLPDQRLALPDALAAYTINGAFVNHEEHETGSLEPGKAADLIVLDKNLFAIDPSEIHKAKVVMTMLDGAEVFRDESFPQQDVAQLKSTSQKAYAGHDHR